MTHRIFIHLAAFAAASVFSFGACAQSSSVPRPDLKVGDRWKIEEQDPLTKLVRSSTEEAVVSVDSEKIGMTFDGQLGTVTLDLTTLDNNRLSYDKGYQFLRFPLEIGKKWDFKTNWTNKQTGNSGRSEFDVEVLSKESISVPAGTFDAFKIRAKGYMYRNGTWNVTITYWYAPQAKKIARIEWRDHKRDLDFNRYLVEYKIAD